MSTVRSERSAQGPQKNAADLAGEILTVCERDLENLTGGEIDTAPEVAEFVEAQVPAERLLAILRALKAGAAPRPQHLSAAHAGERLIEICARVHDFAAQVYRNQCAEESPPEDEFHLFPPALETALDAFGMRDPEAKGEERMRVEANAINRAGAERHSAAAATLREKLPPLFRDLAQALERERGGPGKSPR